MKKRNAKNDVSRNAKDSHKVVINQKIYINMLGMVWFVCSTYIGEFTVTKLVATFRHSTLPVTSCWLAGIKDC